MKTSGNPYDALRAAPKARTEKSSEVDGFKSFKRRWFCVFCRSWVNERHEKILPGGDALCPHGSRYPDNCLDCLRGNLA